MAEFEHTKFISFCNVINQLLQNKLKGVKFSLDSPGTLG